MSPRREVQTQEPVDGEAVVHAFAGPAGHARAGADVQTTTAIHCPNVTVTLGGPGSVRDWLAVSASELKVTVAVGVYAEPALVDEAMVPTTQHHEVGHTRLTAVNPVSNVMTVHEAVLRAPREPAASIP